MALNLNLLAAVGQHGVLILFTVLSSAAIITFILSSSVLWIAMVFGILVGALMNGCISGLCYLKPAYL